MKVRKKSKEKIGSLITRRFSLKPADLVQWFVVCVLVFVSTALVLSNFDTPLKFRVFSVDSGSMSPALRFGSLVFVRPQSDYKVNDIITYGKRRNLTETVTHRIIRVSEDKDLGTTTFATKGDANEDPDITLVNKTQVVGKVLLSIPLLGFLVALAKTQIGFTFLVVVPATIIIYSEIRNLKNEISAALKEKSKKKSRATKKSKTSSKKTKTRTIKK